MTTKNQVGWIKLHRKLIDNPIIGKQGYLNVWIYFLLKASREKRRVKYNGQTIILQPAELITGRQALSKKLNLSQQTIRTILNYLKSTNQITIKSTNRYSIIKLVNWEEYQNEETQSTNRITSQLTNSECGKPKKPTSRVTTNKNVYNKKDIKEKIIKKKKSSPENKYPKISDLTEKDIHQIADKYQTTEAFVKSKIDDMANWAGQPRNAAKIRGRNWRLTLMDWVKRDKLKIMQKQNERQTKFAIVPGAE